MQRTIETSMLHEQPSWWIAKEVEFCHKDGEGDAPCCHICDERIVELAIRKEFALLQHVLSVIVKEPS